jgi:uncharacterized protein (TIGR00251 family)
MVFEKVNDGALLRIKLTPSASKNAVEGVFQDTNGIAWLKVKVAAIPEDGKANNALIKLLSKYLKIPKTSFSFHQGEKDRFKILKVDHSNIESLVVMPNPILK